MESKEILKVALVFLVFFVFVNPLGVNVLTFILTLSSFLANGTLVYAYLATFVGGLLLGALNAFVFRKASQNDHVNLAAAVFAPLWGVAPMWAFLEIFNKTYSMINVSSIQEYAASAVVMRGDPADPYISMFLFLAAFNLPFLYFFYKKKDRDLRALLLYVLAPLLYFLLVPWAMESFFAAALVA